MTRLTVGTNDGGRSGVDSAAEGPTDAPPHICQRGEPIIPPSAELIGSGSKCALLAPYDHFAQLPGLNSSSDEDGFSLSADGLVVWFSSNRQPSQGGYDLWMATRSCIDEPFDQPVRMDALNSAADDRAPSLSADGRTLFFASNRPGNRGFDIMAVDLQAPIGPGSSPRFLSLPNVNSFADEITPFAAADTSELYFASNRAEATGGFDIYSSTKLPDGSFDLPRELMLIDSTGDDTSPMITGDGANIYFASNRDDGAHFRIYLSGRSRTFDPFGASAVGNGFPGAASLSGPAPFNERPLFETPDRCILYLTSDGMPTVVNGPADDGRPADAGTGSSMTGYDLYSGNRL